MGGAQILNSVPPNTPYQTSISNPGQGAEQVRAWVQGDGTTVPTDYLTGLAPTPGCVPGTLKNQSWGWAYQILPYVEQQALWEQPNDDVVKGQRLDLYACPTRRKPTVFTIQAGDVLEGRTYKPGPRAQIDYAACRGDDNNGTRGILIRSSSKLPPANVAKVLDGTSNTLLGGERRMAMGWYEYPLTAAMSESDYSGVGAFVTAMETTHRAAGYQPGQDYFRDPGPFSVQTLLVYAWGSAHPESFNGVLADGSVRKIRYSISTAVLLNLCRCNDGVAFDAGSL
jgi:hypothetical protein